MQTRTQRRKLSLALLVLGLGAWPSGELGAQEPDTEPSVIGYDIELDPIAYALSGFSVHAGVRHAAWRFDIGAFAAEPPDWFHGSEGVSAYYSGFGLKADYRFFVDQSGPFVGLEGAVVRTDLHASEGGPLETQRIFNVGVRGGWQFNLFSGFYIVPWVGVGASLGGEDVDMPITGTSETVRWSSQPWYVFPTIHLGWRDQ